MQIYVHSDHTIRVDTRVFAFVEGRARSTLERFQRRITRLEFHLSDVNSHKSSVQEKRCVIEARPAGSHPVVVMMAAANTRSAVTGSLSKLKAALERTLARSHSRSKARHEGAPAEEAAPAEKIAVWSAGGSPIS